jgi:SOS-response transcriptional repressor LexA
MIQQVNNESPEEKNTANKILEVDDESRLDPGTPGEAAKSDTALETVGGPVMERSEAVSSMSALKHGMRSVEHRRVEALTARLSRFWFKVIARSMRSGKVV